MAVLGRQPTTPQELNDFYPHVDDVSNAAHLYAEAMQHRMICDDKQFGILPIAGGAPAPMLPVQPFPADAIEAMETELARNAKTLALLHEAAQMPQCRFPVDLRGGYATLLPHLAKMRDLARLLAIQAICGALEGSADVAVNAVLDALALAESLRNEPLVTSQAVRAACLKLAIESLEQVINRIPLRDTQLQYIQKSLAGIDLRSGLTRAYQADLCNAMNAPAETPEERAAREEAIAVHEERLIQQIEDAETEPGADIGVSSVYSVEICTCSDCIIGDCLPRNPLVLSPVIRTMYEALMQPRNVEKIRSGPKPVGEKDYAGLDKWIEPVRARITSVPDDELTPDDVSRIIKEIWRDQQERNYPTFSIRRHVPDDYWTTSPPEIMALYERKPDVAVKERQIRLSQQKIDASLLPYVEMPSVTLPSVPALSGIPFRASERFGQGVAAGRMAAKLAATQAALAVERYRQKHGRITTNWSDLVPEFVPEVILDPFTHGSPIILKEADQGHLAYSIGDNGIDDGGTEGNGRPPLDQVFRVFRRGR